MSGRYPRHSEEPDRGREHRLRAPRATTAVSPTRRPNQLEISDFGYYPGDPQGARFYPWVGFRLGVIGSVD